MGNLFVSQCVDDGTKIVSIVAGGWYVTAEPTVLRTLLGSCVAVCLYDPVKRVAGMNHFLLSHSERAVLVQHRGRYADWSLPNLLEEMLRHGARRDQLRVSLFGGGHMSPEMVNCDVGQQNACWAEHFVRAQRLRLVQSDLRGYWPRRVQFDSRTGDIQMQRLPNSARTPLVNQVSTVCVLGE